MITSLHMRPVIRATTVVYLCGQTLDILTTFIGVAVLGATEGNPLVSHVGWVSALMLKLAAMIVTAWFLQVDKPKICLKVFDWIFPAIAMFPVCWNILKLFRII